MLVAQLEMFGANIFLLIGLLIATGALLLLVIAAWTGANVFWWRRDQRRAQEDYQRKRLSPDGALLPPAARGICDACGRPQPEVYHLPTGERVCRRHYAARSTELERAQRRNEGPA